MSMPEEFLREHLGALQEKSFALTVEGQAHVVVLIKDAKEYGQAALEAGRSAGEQELRECLQLLRGRLYHQSECGVGFIRCGGCGISSLRNGPWNHVVGCDVERTEAALKEHS